MPLIDINKPDIIKFLVENYDKTARLRMKWNNTYGEKLSQAATLTREEKGYRDLDVTEAAMAAGMPAIERDHVTGARNRMCRPKREDFNIPCTADLRKEHSIVDIGLGDSDTDPRLARPDTDLTPDPIMRPVDPKLKEIIYKDVPVYGREVYLQKRYKMAPEEKFYFQECSGWDYGWRLKDSFFSRNMTQFGRVWRLNRDLKGRSGPQPDPPHYKDSDPPAVSKCNT